MAFVNASASLTNGQTLELDLSDSQGTVLIRVAGTWSGTIFPEGTIDGTNWFQVNVSDYDAADGQIALDIQANNVFAANGAGLFKFRLNASAISGTAVCSIGASGAVTVVSANQSVQYINASTLPLPADAASQTTQTAQSALIGAVNETAPASDTASSGLNGRLQRIAQRITSLITAVGSPFQAGGSIGNTSFIATQATGTNLHTVVDSGTITANAGTNLNTSALALETTQSAQSTLIGAVNETAPASDTASSGLNGRLQRIAQRLTSLIALVPASLGQKTMANSFAVTLASDQTSIPVAATLAAETTKVIGTVNIAAAQSVTANAGTNLNTSALNLETTQTAMSAKLPATLGQKAMAASMAVVLASDQSSVPVSATVAASTKATYGCGFVLSVVTGATDAVVITGSATKTIKITRILLTASATAAATVSVSLIRRSAANTAGTSTAPAIAKYDSTSAAATAVVTAYTANPSALGATVATVAAKAITLPLAGNQLSDNYLVFGGDSASPFVLRGTSEFLAINFNAAAMITAVGRFHIEFTEE